MYYMACWSTVILSSFHFNTSLPPTHTSVSPSSSSLPETPFSSLPPFFQYLLHLQISLPIKKQGLTDSGQHLIWEKEVWTRH